MSWYVTNIMAIDNKPAARLFEIHQWVNKSSRALDHEAVFLYNFNDVNIFYLFQYKTFTPLILNTVNVNLNTCQRTFFFSSVLPPSLLVYFCYRKGLQGTGHRNYFLRMRSSSNNKDFLQTHWLNALPEHWVNGFAKNP